ncbi:hypothetical protein [Nonomuraea sp. NPDC003201]
MNNPGSVSTRMPRLARRLSLARDVLDVVPRQGQGQVTGARGAADLAEDGENLPVGGVIGDSRRRRDRFGRGEIVLGEGDQGLATDPQVLHRLAEFAQTRGESAEPASGSG